MGLGNKELALVLLMLLAKMGAFSHWPMFLFEQKLDDVAHQLEHCKTSEDWKLWRCVKTVLETDRDKKFVLEKS